MSSYKSGPVNIARSLPELRAMLADARPVALVPTMGALHSGHRALVEEAVTSGLPVVASIFVNPLQFGPREDIARYPRDEAGDLAKLRDWGCRLVWMPDVAVMYPPGDATTILPAGPAEGWEGEVRPEHFRGVATVVAKLFGQVRPDRAYFGEKDWQQLQVVLRMVEDLAFPVEIVAVPTVREDDGLALSSRNRFLTPAQRSVAPHLYAALTATARAIGGGESVAVRLAETREALAGQGFGIDYFDLVDGPSMVGLQAARPGARLVAAVRLGTVRLLDNVAAEAKLSAGDPT